MNKQEEIREGVARNIAGPLLDWELTLKIADQVLQYLHSQGVVIKVEREIYEGYQEAVRAGYVAVEPLIEEE